MTRRLLELAALSLCTLTLNACAIDEDSDSQTRAGALLYELNEAEIVDIHQRYASDEDFELFRDRLVAPFDCAPYSQFCAQVGRDAAYEITGEMVDLALEGVELEAIEDHFATRVDELLALDEDEASDEDEFRSGSTGWTTQTNGGYRMRVRNGVTTPLFGKRQVWTQASTQKKGLFGWSNSKAANLCVNAGTNIQQELNTTYFPFMWTTYQVLETRNPVAVCDDVKSLKVQTEHYRYNAHNNNDGSYTSYRIYANGCANGSIGGVNFNACASEYTESF